MNEAALQLEGIEKTYNRGRPGEVQVLRGVNLTVAPGEVVALVAPSGAGKSTLLHIAGLLDTPDTGAVRIAAEAGVPLVPVILWGTQRLMTKDHPKDFSRGKTIAIRVGEPLHPTGTDPVAETADLRGRMDRMLEETIAAYPAQEQPPGSWWTPARFGGSAPTPEEAERLDAEEKRRRAEARRARQGDA